MHFIPGNFNKQKPQKCNKKQINDITSLRATNLHQPIQYYTYVVGDEGDIKKVCANVVLDVGACSIVGLVGLGVGT